MITGFNTDIEFQGKTYHVQTEDKGVANHLILSLVYDGGTILASKRTDYSDLVQSGFDEAVLTARLRRQHKLMCAAIRAGKIDELKEMTVKQAAKLKNSVETVAVVDANPNVLKIEDISAANLPESAILPVDDIDIIPVEPVQSSDEDSIVTVSVDIEEDQSVHVDDKNEAETGTQILPPVSSEAYRVNAADRDLFDPYVAPDSQDDHKKVNVPEQDDYDYVATLSNNTPAVSVKNRIVFPENVIEVASISKNKTIDLDKILKIEINDDHILKSGQLKTLHISVLRGQDKIPVKRVQMQIKVLGSAFPALTYKALSNENGVVSVDVNFPAFETGNAALLIKAIAEGEEAHLRRVIERA